MRSDALRRRKTLLRVARQLFAESGRDVSLETIAANSDVGIATLYRNFSSREQLINAVTQDVISDVNEATDRLQRSELRADQMWQNFVHHLTGLHLGALTEVMSMPGKPVLFAEVLTEQQLLMHRLDLVLGKLREAGVLRDEVTAASLIASIAMITRPQPLVIRDLVPGLQGQLVESYVLWSRETHHAS